MAKAKLAKWILQRRWPTLWLMVRVEPGREKRHLFYWGHEGQGEFERDGRKQNEKLGKPKLPQVFTGDSVRWKEDILTTQSRTLKWEFEKDGGFCSSFCGTYGKKPFKMAKLKLPAALSPIAWIWVDVSRPRWTTFSAKHSSRQRGVVRLINGLIEETVHSSAPYFQALGTPVNDSTITTSSGCQAKGPSGISNPHSLVWPRKGPGGARDQGSTELIWKIYQGLVVDRLVRTSTAWGAEKGDSEAASTGGPRDCAIFTHCTKFTQREVHPKRVETHAGILLTYWACGLWPSRRENHFPK